MEQSIAGKKLTYLSCDKGGLHEGEALNYICIDDKCKQRGLQCSICLNQDHEKHNYMPLKIFLSQLTQCHQESFGEETNIENFLEKIEKLQQSNLYSLKIGVQKLADDVRKLENQLIETYSFLKSKIISQSYLSKNAPIVIDALINGDYAETKKIKEDCRQLVDNIKVKEEKISFDFEPSKVIESFQRCEEIFKLEMDNFSKTLGESFSKLNGLLEQAQQSKSLLSSEEVKFVASKKYSSESWVKIENNIIKFKNRNESSYTHISSEKLFYKNDKVKLTFRISNYNYHNPSHLWCGICKEAHKDTNFWKSSGNQIDLLQKSQNWKTAWQVTGVIPGNIAKEGSIFELEFCVKDNYMQIQDSEKKSICKITSSTNLNSNTTDTEPWVIVFGTHKSDIHVEIL